MKRVLLTVALCVIASASFAQKKAVSQAQNIAKGDKADYAEARTLIQGALENPETKDDAKTWFVAGYIEDQQFSTERMKEMLGQQPNQPVMYQALLNALPYFEKSYELDQLPDAKGKIKPKHTKDIKGVLSANHIQYFNAGAYYFDQRDYRKAYESFEKYLVISDHPMFKGEPVAARDSNFMIVQFYSGVAATQLGEPQTAIAALNRAKETDYKGNEVYQYLFGEYQQLNDSVNMEKVLIEGLQKFPEEKFYMLHLINIYIYSNRNEEAIQYLQTAINDEPNNPQLYDVLGSIYESLKDVEKAEATFKKALEIDPQYVDALSNLGRLYYNQAVTIQGDANMISDNKLYQEELAKAKALFEQARPFFEQARQLKPEQTEYLVALRGIYYNLNMGKEYDEIEALLNK
ncbi:tetratricopeptide repeat protein [Parabacteroides sp. 52]|uniref:tetratricopeptide repeat protein n=1 Tax=unclassified Parabacteroides TaxID=2649774 RepID=UPI0013D78611|nr:MULTISPECIES: tetratricopeptide repeat protein [unclassified Parabacteroides]MDH6533444.1 tetratricopeptide (TPR) repeat protein [Parabacteroides sp. PM5-20]NDV54201.1 tetratricopeptide repeat protein [Parabacteroides sp. 52]